MIVSNLLRPVTLRSPTLALDRCAMRGPRVGSPAQPAQPEETDPRQPEIGLGSPVEVPAPVRTIQIQPPRMG